MKERDVERYLVKRAKALGGEVRKVQWIGHRGAPDRLVMLPYGSWKKTLRDPGDNTFWVELKAPGVKAEAHQLREHDRMRKKGQTVVIIDSLEGVDNLLGVV